MQGVILCTGTHHVKGTAAVPAVLPAPTILVPALKLLCHGNTQAQVITMHGPKQVLAPLLQERKQEIKSAEISQGKGGNYLIAPENLADL